MISQKTLDCYKANYGKGWQKYADNTGCWINLPAGIIIAINLLIDEVERLNRRKRRK